MDLLRKLLKPRAPRPRKDTAAKPRRRRTARQAAGSASHGRREMSNAEVVREALLRG